MDADRLFVATLDDLAEAARWQSAEYDLLRAAGLLRKLLLDERPLVHQVKGPGRPEPTYRVRFRKPDPSGEPWRWLDAMDPETTLQPDEQLAGPVRRVDLRGLLAVQVISLGCEGRRAGAPVIYLTIRDLIRYHSHVGGGVHHDPAWERQHIALEQFPVKIAFGTVPMELMAISPITQVVLRALGPVRNAIEIDLRPVLR